MKPTTCLLTLAFFAFGCAGATDEGGDPAVTTEAPINPEAFDVDDEGVFRQLIPADASVTKLAGDFQFVEGPVWVDDEGGYLIFSDIPANELKRWDPTNGVQTFRMPSGMANGNTLDLQGRLITAQHDGRVTRTEDDGTVTMLVEEYMGSRLSSPNDVIVKSDGTIWFTDPDYGLGDREQQTPGNYVYRFDAETSELTAAVTDMVRPNGLCFSPNETTLYIADSGDPRHIRAFTVGADNALSGGEVFATLDQGFPDGIRCDERGNVWSTSGEGAQIFAPSGERIARILLPESGANLAFGGSDGTTVFFTARTSLYSVPSLVQEAKSR